MNIKCKPDFSNTTVIVIGDIMIDIYLWGKVKRISPEAPVPVVTINNKTHSLGGAGNVSLNLSRLGCKTFLLSTTGDDPQADQIRALLDKNKITHKLFQDKNTQTITKTRIIGQGQQLLRIDEEKIIPPNTLLLNKIIKIFDDILPGADAVILSDYGKGLLLSDIPEIVIEKCRKMSVPVLVDPKTNNWDRYKRATCVTPNLMEFSQVSLSPENLPEKMAPDAEKIIKRFDLDHLLVTLGSRGMCLFFRNKKPFHIQTEAKDVYDVSGAGDTVISILAAAYGRGFSTREAASLANTAAGIVVEKLGTKPVEIGELTNALEKKSTIGLKKIMNVAEAETIISSWKNQGNKIVFTNGCFDILHAGHIKLLHAAAENGTKLIIGLNSDSSVKRLKGSSRPILPENERAALLSAIYCVDMVVIFHEDTPINLIKSFIPDILVKGGDYTVETVVGHDIVAENNGSVVLVPLEEGISTTNIIKSLET